MASVQNKRFREGFISHEGVFTLDSHWNAHFSSSVNRPSLSPYSPEPHTDGRDGMGVYIYPFQEKLSLERECGSMALD